MTGSSTGLGRAMAEAARVSEAPSDGGAPEGPEGIFIEADLDQLLATLGPLADAAR